VLDFFENGRVVFNELPITLHKFESVTLDLCKKAYDENSRLIIVGPFFIFFVPLVISLIVHHYESSTKFGTDPLKRPSFLLLTKSSLGSKYFRRIYVSTRLIADMSTRRLKLTHSKFGDKVFIDIDNPRNCHLYWKHFMIKRYGKNNVPEYLKLNCFFPVARRYGNKWSVIDSRDHLGRYDCNESHWLYITREVPAEETIPEEIDCVIADFPRLQNDDRMSLPRGIPVFYIFDNPADYRIGKYISEADESVIWNPQRLSETEVGCELCERSESNNNAFFSRSGVFIRNLTEAEFKIYTVKGGLSDKLKTSSKLIENISRKIFRSSSDSFERGVKLARIALSLLVNLPISVRDYDINAVINNSPSISDIIHEIYMIYSYDKKISLKERSLLHDIYLFLDDLKSAIDRANPKMIFLLSFIKSSIPNCGKIGIAVQDRFVANVLQRSLYGFLCDNDPIDDKLPKVITVKELKLIPPADTLILTGCRSVKLMEALFGGYGRKIILMGYRDELRDAVNYISHISKLISMLERKSAFKGKMRDLAGLNADSLVREVINESGLSGGENSGKIPAWYKLKEILEGKRYITPLMYVSASSEKISPTARDDKSRWIVFTDGTRMLCRSSDSIRILKPDDMDTTVVKPEELKSGDNVIIVNGSVRDAIYDEILKQMEEVPERWYDLNLIRFWQTKIREGFFERNLSYNELHSALKAEGTSIQTASAIANWLNGSVMGPSDPEDIRRMGVVLNIEALKKNWVEINDALRRIRAINRVIARCLNEMVIHGALGTIRESEIIDLEEYGISMDELLDSVEIKTVERVELADF
jgi:hypothetical protein